MGRMKIQPSLRIILAGVLFLFVNACATNAPQSGPARWPAHGPTLSGTVWTVKADGTFDVDRNHDGKRHIWGNYTVSADTLTVQETGGNTAERLQRPRRL